MRTRCFVAFALVAALSALPAAARERQQEGFFTTHQLVHSSFSVGEALVDVYATPAVDARQLVSGLALAKVATADAIMHGVDARRRAAYGDQEIALVVQPASQAVPGEKAGLVRAIYWWNNENADGDSWYAQYTSTVAVLFTDAVQFGHFDIYDRANSNWVYREFVEQDEAYSRANQGGRALRGFQGVATGDSKADVVMYFFK